MRASLNEKVITVTSENMTLRLVVSFEETSDSNRILVPA